MKENGIHSQRPRKFKATTNSKHNYPVAENLVKQNFKVKGLNQLWASDITYIPTDEGWLYLAAVIDLCDKQVVGWSLDSTMTKELAMNALECAILRTNQPRGVIHHSDRGSQYASYAYQALLKRHGFVSSMSRKGNCFDNACAESFFSTLKNELVYLTRFRTRNEARLAIFEYIEAYYNRNRGHSSLGYMSPCEYREHLKSRVAA
ncbi:IS2 transposase TnpB [Peptococcaceae bacterium CEB3]|nr:IS2 transposase TnpB [Peptococcaceae bacterium CEB3]